MTHTHIYRRILTNLIWISSDLFFAQWAVLLQSQRRAGVFWGCSHPLSVEAFSETQCT